MKKLVLLMLGVLVAFPVFALEFEYTYEYQTLKHTANDTPEGSLT